jgi:hypothetical protein
MSWSMRSALLEFTYKWEHSVLVFLCLLLSVKANTLQFPPCYRKWGFHPFYGWIALLHHILFIHSTLTIISIPWQWTWVNMQISLSLPLSLSLSVGLGFELRALHLQNRYFTAWATPPVHFALVIFWKWVGLENYLSGLALNHDPPNLILPSS